MAEIGKVVSEREPGFYWVRDREGWCVAEWYVEEGYPGYWRFPGWEVPVQERDLEEVDERRVRR